MSNHPSSIFFYLLIPEDDGYATRALTLQIPTEEEKQNIVTSTITVSLSPKPDAKPKIVKRSISKIESPKTEEFVVKSEAEIESDAAVMEAAIAEAAIMEAAIAEASVSVAEAPVVEDLPAAAPTTAGADFRCVNAKEIREHSVDTDDDAKESRV